MRLTPRELAARADERERMVTLQLAERGIADERVLAALRRVPRERFVPRRWRAQAYDDGALDLGWGATISQPFVVAWTCEALALRGDERVLEVGAGSGYQAAVLGELAREVHALELVPELAERARATLAELGCDNVHVHAADGRRGWPAAAPFEAICAAAVARTVPPALVEQLRGGGRLCLPLERGPAERQELVLFHKLGDGTLVRRAALDVRFVRMAGEE